MHSPDTAFLNGTILTPQTFVSIHWSYIAMLAVQLGLTLFFLAAVITRTMATRVQVLKGSSLATLSGLDNESRSMLGGIQNSHNLKERATALRVRLERGLSGMALWLGRPANGQGHIR